MTPPEPGTPAVFDHPWQARAFALMLKLREHGHFTPAEWSAALGKEIHGTPNADPEAPIPRVNVSDYYQHWLSALEALVLQKGLTDRAALLMRKQAWEAAYRRTPHGKPVELG